MRSARACLLAVAGLAAAACGGGPAATTQLTPTIPAASGAPATVSPSSPPASSARGALNVPTGIDLCNLLSAADFTDAGINGAGQVNENNLDTEFYCTYAGESAATGGIELDAFVVESDTDRDEIFASVSAGEDAEDVTALIGAADRATLGTTTSGGPEFAQIAVRSGNFIFGLGIPMTGDWHSQLIALANLVMVRAAAVSS